MKKIRDKNKIGQQTQASKYRLLKKPIGCHPLRDSFDRGMKVGINQMSKDLIVYNSENDMVLDIMLMSVQIDFAKTKA